MFFKAGDHQKIGIPARGDGGADLRQPFLPWDNLLVVEMAALLGRNLILDMHAEVTTRSCSWIVRTTFNSLP